MPDNIGTIPKALCFRDPYKAIFKRVPISFPDFWTNTQNQSVEKSPPKLPSQPSLFRLGSGARLISTAAHLTYMDFGEDGSPQERGRHLNFPRYVKCQFGIPCPMCTG